MGMSRETCRETSFDYWRRSPDEGGAMSREEEYELVLRAQAGDQGALAKLLQAHKRHIRRLARRYRCRGLTDEDQYQNGAVAFNTKFREFDPDRGFRLWTYVQPWIRGTMIEACAQQGGLSDRARKTYRRIATTYRQLQQDQLAEPTVEQVAAQSNVPIKAVEEVFAHRQGRTVRLPEEDEASEEGGRHTVPPALQEPSPEEFFGREEETKEGFGQVFRHLGRDNGTKFLVLAVLREGVFEGHARGYDWAEIAGLLADPQGGPNPPWGEKLLADFPHLPALPPTWGQVCAFFSTPPPALTEQALKQWYSRMSRSLRSLD